MIDDLQLEALLCFPLYAASRQIGQAYRPLLADLGLTYPQYLVMVVLWERDGLSVGQIGARLFLDSGTLTPLLKRLERQGMVDRRRSVVDERTVQIHLTPEGSTLREQAVGLQDEMIRSTGLAPESVAAFREAVTTIRRTLLGERP